MSLVSRLRDLMRRSGDRPRDAAPEEEGRLAAAALLVHVARADGRLDGPERRRLVALVGERFSLDGEAAERFVERADALDRETDDVATLVAMVGRDLDRPQRRTLVGLAYAVAAADGAVGEFEDDLVWRLGRLLGFDDGEIAAVRAEALPRAAREKAPEAAGG